MAQNERLRIATFNIKHGAKAAGYIGRAVRVQRACRELDADILALQEVDVHIWRSLFADLARAAQGDTYRNMYFAKAMGATLLAGINPGGRYGNALLVKGELQAVQEIPLTGDYKRLSFRGRRYETIAEPRNAILASVQTKGQRVAVAATHLGGKPRFVQLEELGQRLAARPEPAKVLLGDFNMPEPRVPGRLPEGMVMAAGGPYTNPSPRPSRSLDHVAVAGMEVVSVSARAFSFSDHLARVVEVQLPH